MADRPYLPESPIELTPNWLSAVLAGEVMNVQQRVLGDGQGFMGDVIHLQLDSSDSHIPSTLVAKLPKKNNRVFGELLGVYEREIMFFREFSERMPVRVPRMYFSEFDRDKGSENQRAIIGALDRWPAFMGRFIGWTANHIAAAKKRRYLLLIEYLDGMNPGDQVAGLDLDQCAQVLRSIAAMHRAYWDDSKLVDHFWLLHLDIDARMQIGRAHV